jgi:hypothetical protein
MSIPPPKIRTTSTVIKDVIYPSDHHEGKKLVRTVNQFSGDINEGDDGSLIYKIEIEDPFLIKHINRYDRLAGDFLRGLTSLKHEVTKEEGPAVLFLDKDVAKLIEQLPQEKKSNKLKVEYLGTSYIWLPLVELIAGILALILVGKIATLFFSTYLPSVSPALEGTCQTLSKQETLLAHQQTNPSFLNLHQPEQQRETTGLQIMSQCALLNQGAIDYYWPQEAESSCEFFPGPSSSQR